MFLTQEDLTANVNDEIVRQLSRFSEEVVLVQLGTAEIEIESHLVSRYLIRPELEKAGDDRNKLLVKIGVSLATYYLYQPADTIPSKIEKAWERANTLLKMLVKGEIKLVGVPAPPPDEDAITGSSIAWGGVARRPTLY